MKERLARAGAAGLRVVRAGCGRAGRLFCPWLAAAAAGLRLAGQLRKPLAAALAVGAVAALAAFVAGPWLAAAASGLGGFCTTLAAQAALRLRRMFGPIALA